MSWLGGSFSSITDQLSNLTKDILTEGTEEVSDPVTELKVAKAKIQELELLLTSQKSENDRVKLLIREAEERAEASELQVNAISTQYRGLLQQKQDEIKELKQKHHEMLESQMNSQQDRENDSHHLMSYHSAYSRSMGVTHAGSSEAFPGDDHDFGDSISMQHEINRLSKEVQRLQSENNHWKRMAAEAGGLKTELVRKDEGHDVSRLQTEIKNLQHELSTMQEQHQQEVVALQDYHRSQLASLKQRHQVELTQAQEQAEEEALQQQQHTETAGDFSALQEEVSNLQHDLVTLREQNGQLKTELEAAVRDRDRATSILSELEAQSAQTKAQAVELEAEAAGLRSERSSLQDKVTRLKEALKQQTTQIADFEADANRHGEENKQVRAELFDVKQNLLDQLDSNHAHVLEVLGDLQQVRHQMDNETLVRKSKVLREKEKLVNLLIAAGDKKSELSKQMSDTVQFKNQLASDTKDMIKSLGSPGNLEVTKGMLDSLQQENSTLKQRTIEQEERISQLETSMAKVNQEKANLEKKLQDLQEKGLELPQSKGERVLSETESQWDLSIDNDSRPVASTPYVKNRPSGEASQEDQGREFRHLTSQLRVYQDQLEEYECMKADWQVEKEALEDVLMGLRKQLREKEAALTTAQPAVQTEGLKDSEIKALQNKIKNLEGELQILRKKNEELLKAVDLSKGAMSELEEVRNQLEKKAEEVLNLTSEKSELEAGLEELDSQHNAATEELIRIRNGLVQQADALRTQVKEKDSRIDQLNRQLQDLQVTAADQSRDQSQDLSEVSLELERMRREYEKLKLEKEQQSEQLGDEAQALSQLHMDKQELEEKVRLQETEVEETREKLTEVKQQCEATEEAYRSTVEKLQLAERQLEALEESAAFDSSTQEQLETELEELKCQLNDSLTENQTQQGLVAALQAELDLSKAEVVSLRSGQAVLEEGVQRTDGQSPGVDAREVSALRSENQALYMQLEALRVEKVELEKELDQMEQKLQKQHKNYENYIHDIQKGQVLESSALQEEHSKSILVSHEKDMKISQLEEEILALRIELEDSRETMQSALESQQQLSGLVSEKEAEILSLRRENLHLTEKIEEQEKNMSDLEIKLGTLEGTQTQLSRSREENRTLQDELKMMKITREDPSVDSEKSETQTLDVMTAMESELTLARDKVRALEEEVGRLTQLVGDLEASIREMNDKTHLQGKEVQEYAHTVSTQDNMIAVLQQTSLQKETEISDIRQRLHRATSLIESDKLPLLEQNDGDTTHMSMLPAIEYPEKGTLDLDETEAGGPARNKVNSDSREGHEPEVNGRLSGDWSDGSNDSVTAEIEQLQCIIKGKDQVIAELQNSNSSLMKMLESKPLTSGGERTLVDVHKLENEVRALKTEREQILAVMNEKSRESSKLKSEVHRLMNIISAEKTALDKLTQDNNHLVRKREGSPNEDMQKEAIQNLSRIIRDKDMEMEALRQKNETLVQVLQDSSQDGSQISSLMVDKENLSKQLATLQAERDQMVAFVNQKHQESVAYHNEVQRLTAYINTENEKYENVQRDYANLVPEFEDKKQALLKAQNELINYKQKYAELEVKYGELVQRSNVSETVDVSTYNMKAQEASKLQERVSHFQQSLQTKETKINSLTQRLNELELSTNSLESEKNNYKKQVEHLSFQMQSLRREVEVVRQDSVDAEHGKEQQISEMQVLREANDKAMMSLREKEFEVTMLKEKCTTLTSLLQERDGQEGQLDRLLRDNEAVNQQAQVFQQEKDQLMIVLRQRQAEADQLREQVEKHKQKEQKLNGELDRLRNHLLQIEEGYTQEALAAEEREKELRNRLASLEEKVLSSSAAVENVNAHAGQQLESLQQQLVAIGSQRDAAYHQVALLQEQCQQYSASLANLQLVLEQFQQDRESTLATETDRYRSQIAELTSEVARLRSELADTKSKLEEASDGLEAAARLSEQVDKKEATIQALREEVQLREQALQSSEDEKKKLATTSEAKVDKVLVKNLLVGYLSTPQSKRNEALRVIGVVLNFSQEDFHKVVGNPQGSWIPGFLRFGRSPSTPPHSPARVSHGGLDKSFSELFVKFLEKESSPPPPIMQLPAEQMAQETRQKHKHDREKEREDQGARQPQFNPFTAPRHAVMPVQVGGRSSPHDSHLLISSSLSPALPVVAPLATREGAITPVLPTQNTPMSSSAILKDVLGNR